MLLFWVILTSKRCGICRLER